MSKPLSRDQKTFNKSARHLLKQNKKSKADYDGIGDLLCAYRGEDGLRCAAGVLIPNHKYSKSFEGKRSSGVRVGPVLESCGHNTRLTDCLQDVHDNYEPEDWKMALENVARKFNLKMVKV